MNLTRANLDASNILSRISSANCAILSRYSGYFSMTILKSHHLPTWFVYHAFKPRVFACLEDSEEKETSQAQRPDPDKYRSNDLSCIIEMCVCQRCDCDSYETCAPKGVIEFLCLEGTCQGPSNLQNGKESNSLLILGKASCSLGTLRIIVPPAWL